MMIKITATDKVQIAKFGANKLFRIDYKTRKGMDDSQLLELFDDAWENRLKYLVESAEVIQQEEVSRRLLDKHHTYIDSAQEHRSFHYLKAEFIAQLRPLDSNQYELTQLWRVSSLDAHPNTLFITFSSIAEREQFSALARNLRKNEEDIALKLIRNFMELTECTNDNEDNNLDTIEFNDLF